MSDPASREAVESAIADWSEAVLRCRLANRHSFQPLTAHRNPGGRSLHIHERCIRTVGRRILRCGVEQEYDMDMRGWIITKPKAHYPSEGYLLKGLGRVDTDGRAAIRLAVVLNGLTIQDVPS